MGQETKGLFASERGACVRTGISASHQVTNLQSEEDEEGNHQTEETHGFGEGESKNGVAEDMSHFKQKNNQILRINNKKLSCNFFETKFLTRSYF